jgi:Family of unknown function (DUF5995)
MPIDDGMARLAELAGRGAGGTIAEVLDRLAAIRDHAAATSARGEDDGIAAFSGLHHVITATLDELDAGSEFLVRLHLETAQRYFAALRGYALDPPGTPLAWRVLFDNRADPAVPVAGFTVAGLNAQLNLDLAGALVSTWEHIAPDDGAAGSRQYRDYCLVNEVCEASLDPLRDRLSRSAPDPAAAHLSDLVIRFTHDLAWDEAREVWTDGADDQRRRASEDKLDTIAGVLGARLLGIPHPVRAAPLPRAPTGPTATAPAPPPAAPA